MKVADELLAVVDAAVDRVGRADEAATSVRPGPGKWSSKEVLGHLIDSAANNHQRFVRAQEGPVLALPGYAQDHWVQSQDYQARRWEDLLRFWQTFNHHLAHVIRRIPDAALSTECRIGGGEPVTLAFLVDDYLRHLKHHVEQIDRALVRS